MILAAIQAAETAGSGLNMEIIGITVIALGFSALLIKLALSKDPDEPRKPDDSAT